MDSKERPPVEGTVIRCLAESIPEGVLVVSPEGKILFFNRRFLEIWKIPEEILEPAVDRAALEWAAEQTADPSAFLASVAEVYDHPSPAPLRDELLMKDGRVLERLGTPCLHGRTNCGWLWTFHDITEFKATEASLRHLGRSLERRVLERTRELEEQSNRLRSLATELVSAEHRERKRLAAILHDDLQQLLVAAGMHLVSLGKCLGGPEDREKLDQVAGLIREAGDVGRDLTHQLRPPALYEGGLLPALNWLAGSMGKRHRLRVSVDGPSSPPRLSDDFSALLFDCARELLFNVVKHARAEEASVSLRQDGRWLELAVEDSGRGMDAGGEKRKGKQSGFGVFSIRERMVGLGGDMNVESRPGRTRITLRLPLSAALAEAAPAPGAGRLRSESRMDRIPGVTRVVVVDDHALVRQGIAEILRGDGRILVVGEAADGIEAIRTVGRSSPEVVLMDVNMPRMNGVEATREIRRRWPKTIVIGLSVQDDEATRSTMLDAGAEGFLGKGGNAGEMIEHVLGLAGRPGSS